MRWGFSFCLEEQRLRVYRNGDYSGFVMLPASLNTRSQARELIEGFKSRALLVGDVIEFIRFEEDEDASPPG